MLSRKNVQVYLLSEVDHKVLMLKRTKERSGKWQPVCGGIENFETVNSAAFREVYEETKIALNNEIEILPLHFQYETDKNKIMYSMEDFCAVVLVEKPLEVELSHEHDAYIWCNLDEVKVLTDWEPILQSVNFIKSRMNRE